MKIFSTKLAIITLCILCMQTTSFAQIPGIVEEPEYQHLAEHLEKTTIFKICGGDNTVSAACPNPGEVDFMVHFRPGCELGYIVLSVYAVNLELYEPTVVDGNYTWPLEQPLYVRIFEGEYSKSIGPITEFRPVNPVQNTEFNFYRSRIVITTPKMGEIDCDKYGVWSDQHEIELGVYTPGIGDLEPFPIENYAGPQEVFSCQAFWENYPGTNGENCVNEIDGIQPEYQNKYDVCHDCGTCVRDDDSPGGNDGDPEPVPDTHLPEGKLSFNNGHNADLIFNPFPNPFSDELQISIKSDKEKMIYIEMRSIEGKLMTKQIYQLNRGNNQAIMDTNVEPGIYILNITDENEQYSMKLIKI